MRLYKRLLTRMIKTRRNKDREDGPFMTPEPNTESKRKWKLSVNGWKNSITVRTLLFLFLLLFLYVSLAGSLLKETYDIEEGSLSPTTIYAKDRILNEAATERARERAASEVKPVYTYVSMDNLDLISSIYDKLELINPDNQYTTQEKVEIYRDFFPREYGWHTDKLLKKYERDGLNDPLLEEMKKQLESQQYRIPEEVFFQFPRLSVDDIKEMEPVTRNIVQRLIAEQVTNADQARDKVAELVNASQLSKKITRELVQEIARFVITPNRFYDEVALETAIEEAKADVQPVYIEADQAIVNEGQVINAEIYSLLEEQGLLKEKANYGPQIGLLILVGLFVFILFMFIRQSELPIRHNNVQLLMFVMIFTLNILGMRFIALGQNFEYIGYLAPVAMGSMLITILLDTRLAFVASIVFSVVASILFNSGKEAALFDYRYGFVAAVVCFVAIFSIRKASQRSTILKAGVIASLFSTLSLASIILLSGQTEPRDILFALAFAASNGIITSVLVMGLLPFFEVSFGVLSPLKLVELSNPNHPLLRKLLTETPGTYHHSVMVGNLSESAAEAIGADGLLCRVGSFYHDIGKTKRPSYFIENQGSIENPHDKIEPSLSKAIIIAHAKDGADMLKEHKMPKQLCDIAEQHHGTTLLKYFYHKAMKLSEEHAQAGEEKHEEVREQDYRYPGPKAQSKEAAIVGIADCVEAAVRSLRNPTIEQIDSMVDKIIKDRLEDGQFNECDLTLKELNTIGKALKETLLGIFHSRIEYPELSKKDDTKAG